MAQPSPLLFQGAHEVRAVFPDRYGFLAFKAGDFFTGICELGRFEEVVRFNDNTSTMSLRFLLSETPRGGLHSSSLLTSGRIHLTH